jgi:ferredoxin
MTHVVSEPCIRCRYTDCIDDCPVDCFHLGPSFVAIDPATCIDCGLCVAACPVGAIFHADLLPVSQKDFLELNAHFARLWPRASQREPKLPDADQWRDVTDKRRWIAD